MSLPEGRIHIVGIGGSGMSAIAKLLVARGHIVSGSDLRGGASVDALADLEVAVTIGHHPEKVAGAGLVVASSAVPEYDEELTEARDTGVPVWRRPELLAAITRDIPTIGATGTHGKTTTTAMLVTALRHLHEDPSFIVGGDLVDLGTNGHHGIDDLLVLEADEAFRTFESLSLSGLVVTNVEHEHVDHFDDEAELERSFVGVAAAVDGPVVVCNDDPGARRVGEAVGANTYGFAADSDWVIADYVTRDGRSEFTLTGTTGSVKVTLGQPGRHLAQNSSGAIALLVALGRDLEQSAEGVGSFRGVGRRWDHRGTIAGVTLIDDYAHHPTEVAAVLDAASGAAPGRIWAVFQPHLYSRTQRFYEEFGVALARADVSVVTDVFGARETPVPGVTGELVADAVTSAGGVVHYVPHRYDVATYLEPLLEPGDLVLSLGAGDITLLHSELAPLLGARQ